GARVEHGCEQAVPADARCSTLACHGRPGRAAQVRRDLGRPPRAPLSSGSVKVRHLTRALSRRVAKADRMRHNGSMGRRLFSRVCRENQRMRPPLRSLLLFGLLPLALAACGGGGGGGGTSSATTAQTTTSAAHQTKQVTIRVTSVVTSTKAHQRVPKRTSAGDRVEFKDRLLNASA